MSAIGDNSAQRLKSIVERIERVEADIKDMNTDKSEIYKEARGAGYDVKVLREVIKRRRTDPDALQEHESLVDTYLAALGTPVATRARTKDEQFDPETGEIIDVLSEGGGAESGSALDLAGQSGAEVHGSVSSVGPDSRG
jgi:uncharacterized protein (UPF0335 family)